MPEPHENGHGYARFSPPPGETEYSEALRAERDHYVHEASRLGRELLAAEALLRERDSEREALVGLAMLGEAVAVRVRGDWVERDGMTSRFLAHTTYQAAREFLAQFDATMGTIPVVPIALRASQQPATEAKSCPKCTATDGQCAVRGCLTAEERAESPPPAAAPDLRMCDAIYSRPGTVQHWRCELRAGHDGKHGSPVLAAPAAAQQAEGWVPASCPPHNYIHGRCVRCFARPGDVTQPAPPSAAELAVKVGKLVAVIRAVRAQYVAEMPPAVNAMLHVLANKLEEK